MYFHVKMYNDFGSHSLASDRCFFLAQLGLVYLMSDIGVVQLLRMIHLDCAHWLAIRLVWTTGWESLGPKTKLQNLEAVG